eukprot:scaffold227466_cov32-Tisochrysis_lutea.AAC.2
MKIVGLSRRSAAHAASVSGFVIGSSGNEGDGAISSQSELEPIERVVCEDKAVSRASPTEISCWRWSRRRSARRSKTSAAAHASAVATMLARAI